MKQQATEILTLAEVADELRCCTRHVLRLVKAKKLRAVDMGAGKRPRYRFTRHDLERFRTDNRTDGPAEQAAKPTSRTKLANEGVLEWF